MFNRSENEIESGILEGQQTSPSLCEGLTPISLSTEPEVHKRTFRWPFRPKASSALKGGTSRYNSYRSVEAGPEFGSFHEAARTDDPTTPMGKIKMPRSSTSQSLISSPPELESAATPVRAWSPETTESPTTYSQSHEVTTSPLSSDWEHDVACRGGYSSVAQDSNASPREQVHSPLPSRRITLGEVSPESPNEESVWLQQRHARARSEVSNSPQAALSRGSVRIPNTQDDGGGLKTAADEESGCSSPLLTATKRCQAEEGIGASGATATAAATSAISELQTAVDGRLTSEVATGASSAGVLHTANMGRADMETDIVLPCPPSDEEKVCYYKTGRVFLLTFGSIAFCTLTLGMWLFTLASPCFFWFGVPTIFLMVYVVLHYLVVAIWGKDFDPDVHENIVKTAVDTAFLPTVDIFLPVCNEDLALLNNSWKYVSMLDYPQPSVYVLDDGGKDDVRDLAVAYGFQCPSTQENNRSRKKSQPAKFTLPRPSLIADIRRDNRPMMKKAGNLRFAFEKTSGEVVVIFDADFCPRSDFLRETTPYLLDPSIGILQTPQFFRWRKEQTWVEQGASSCQEVFYRMVQMNQDRFFGSVCVGSCGLYRRSAVAPFGGVAAIAHSEDMYTGYKMTELGYQIKYVPLCLAMGTCPDEPRSFFMQQYRWCMGSASLVFEEGFRSANLSTIHKICFINGLLYYIASALLIFLAPMPIMLLLYIKADWVIWYHTGFAVPSIIMVAVVIPYWSKQPYGMPCHRVRIIQCYAHLFALKDRVMGTVAVWVPSGGGASRTSSKAYTSSVSLMLAWTTLTTVLIVGGALWRMMEFTWFHYLPPLVLALGSCYLNVSTIWI